MTGRLVANHDAAERAGDFWFLDSAGGRIDAALGFLCPACGSEHSVGIFPEHGTGWQWDGNRERPTLTPSIQIIRHGSNDNGCRWHGWLRNGEWVNA